MNKSVCKGDSVGLGILFDMDGVIIDTCRLHEESWFSISKICGFPWKQSPDFNFKRDVFGTSSVDSAVLLFGSGILDHDLKAICKKKCEIYWELLRENIHNIVIPGFQAFFESIVKDKIPVALATSSTPSEAEFVLKSLGLYEHFKAVVSIDQVKNPKPHPEVYQKAQQALGMPPSQCIGFEDSLPGVAALEKAGISCVVVGSTLSYERLVSTGLKHELYIPDYSRMTVEDIIDLRKKCIKVW